MYDAGIAGDKFMEAFCRGLYKSLDAVSNVVVISPSEATVLDELCELPISQYDLARNMSYLVSYMNSIVS